MSNCTAAVTTANARMTTKHGVHFDLSHEKAEFNQYWYSPDTIATLFDEVRHHATACAFLSAPSLYFALLTGDEAASPVSVNSRLFEFDKQWEKEPGFVHYDFNKPDLIPVQYFGAFDYVVADPPFITESVWTAYIQTARLVLRPGGKLLFTTVLENHTMLEGLLDGPLFIAPFRPSIAHLTYQYVCFTNYKATRLTHVNAELPPEDPKLLAAVQMANDLRESEEAFTAQMQCRDRQGERPLPAAQHHQGRAETDQQSSADMADLPICAMKWGYIPEGLTMYANGGEAPPPESAESAEATDYGEVYRDVAALRGSLDTFKRHIDFLQQLLDQLLKTQRKHTKHQQKQIVEGDHEEMDAAEEEGKRVLAATLEEMRGIIDTVESAESRLAAATGTPVVQSYMGSMRVCVAAYAAVPIEKQALSELAADATRKFKSPVFNRMKELLQRMKELKRERA